MNEIYNQMLSRYDTSSNERRRNALLEVNQQIVLSGLNDAGFFEEAAFYGGTCLRIFYGLNRFSEDMDFSLLSPNNNFQFEKYFPAIIDAFNTLDRQIDITKKTKKNFGKVESAFLKDNTEVYDLSFQTEKSLKIKIEVDTNPPLLFNTEKKLLLLPRSFYANCFALPDLFAGKMHALVYRQWGHRIKGRDWFDFEWYVRNAYPLNFEHLQERIRQFNGIMVTQSEFHKSLIDKLSSADIERVKEDVYPFISDPTPLDIWSNDYFVQIAQMVRYQ